MAKNNINSKVNKCMGKLLKLWWWCPSEVVTPVNAEYDNINMRSNYEKLSKTLKFYFDTD